MVKMLDWLGGKDTIIYLILSSQHSLHVSNALKYEQALAIPCYNTGFASSAFCMNVSVSCNWPGHEVK